MKMSKRFYPLVGSLLVLVAIIVTVHAIRGPFIIYNATDSLPIGYYLVHKKQQLLVGDIALISPPERIKSLLKERQWLPENGYLMKPVAAIDGDFVCTQRQTLTINKKDYGGIDSVDSLNRLLPQYFYCQELDKDHYYVAVKGNSKSFDSRYFGPLNNDDVKGTVTPLWIF